MRILQVALIIALLVETVSQAENRTLDGSANNFENPKWGAAETNFIRRAEPAYDARSNLIGSDLPNPRVISNALFGQSELHPNDGHLSGFVYAFGQFISHDIQETISGGTEDISIAIPRDDPFFDPFAFPLTRSEFDPETGRGRSNPRQQINFTTTFLDASHVYGSFELISSVLRGGPARPGAKLKTSDDINGDGENLLPRNAFGPVLQADFVAGDSRVNDNVVLSSIHTVFLREHNRLVDEIAADHPEWSEEELFQRARKFVGAELQAITYNEFLPALLGDAAPSLRGNYDPTVNPNVVNEFATVFLRVGHSMLTPDFKRVQNDGTSLPPIDLAAAFFNPAFLDTSAELELLLKGLSMETQEQVDLELVDGMRLALLGAIDLQRARDHGLDSYNAIREAYDLEPATTFAQISSDPEIQAKLEEVYTEVDSVEAFVGALAEDHLPGANVGTLTSAVYIDQFTRLRDGDRFWYSNDDEFSDADLAWIEGTTLGAVIERNTELTSLQSNIFLVSTVPLDCNGDGILDGLDLACSNAADTTAELLSQLGILPGDLDADGSVAFSDFLILSSNFGEPLSRYTDGDIDDNENVGFSDFLAMSVNFGKQTGTTVIVPEPSGFLLCIVGATAGLLTRRKHGCAPN